MSTNNEVYINELIKKYNLIKRIKDENNNKNIFLEITIFNSEKIERINSEKTYTVHFNISQRIPEQMPKILTSTELRLPITEQTPSALIEFINFLLDNNDIDYVVNYMNCTVFDQAGQHMFFLPEIHLDNNTIVTLPHNDLSYLECTTKAIQKAKKENQRYLTELQLLEKEYLPQPDTPKELLQKK